MRVLKNTSKLNAKTIFRGKDLVFRAKRTKVFDLKDEEQKAEYEHWTQIYGFIEDITKRLEVEGKL